MENTKVTGRFADEQFIRLLWNERFPWPIPADSFVRKWTNVQSQFVIGAFKNAEVFHRRFPQKDAWDICRLITSTISASLRVQRSKTVEAASISN